VHNEDREEGKDNYPGGHGLESGTRRLVTEVGEYCERGSGNGKDDSSEGDASREECNNARYISSGLRRGARGA
jgi:hypothetical protein